MSFKELVIKNRSCRGFDEGVKVSREQLLEMVECARLTPSSRNLQPLKYYLSYTDGNNATIQSITKWAAGLPNLDIPYKGQRPTAFIVICYDKDLGGENITPFLKDVGITAQTILLAATEMGLNGCMIGNFSPEKLAAALSLSDNLVPSLVIGIGKGVENIVLTDIKDGKTGYYRDDNNTHYVPKRTLEEEIIN